MPQPDDIHDQDRDDASGARTADRRRAVLSAFLGSTVEYYDFFLYSTAATAVFAKLFFAGMSPAVALIASYGTLATGYVSRPLGGIIAGHFGDRLGRKRMLIVTMLVMGIASALIGVIPAVPVWGAVILVVLRVIQGLAVGGEWGGSALMALEHNAGRRQGFAAAFSTAGAPCGATLGTVMLTVFGLLPDRAFLSWGWRIPFLLSAVLVAIALWVRSRVPESPVFEQAGPGAASGPQPAAARVKVPLLTVLRRPGWLVIAVLATVGSLAMQGVFGTLAISDAVSHGVSESQGLAAFSLSQFAGIFTILYAGRLSDRFGRRPVMLTGFGAMIVLAFPVFALLQSGNFIGVAAGFVIALALCQGATSGPLAAFAAERYGTGDRYTGASLIYQLASLLGAGVTPVIIASIAAANHGAMTFVAVYIMGVCALSAVVMSVFVRGRRPETGQFA